MTMIMIIIIMTLVIMIIMLTALKAVSFRCLKVRPWLMV